MTHRVRLSAAEARRIALAAQGFDRPRPESTPNAHHFKRVLATLGLLQIDFVNVLIPAHFLVVWSRLGAYDRQRFERFVYGSGGFTEQWAHEASIVPVSAWPLLEHRRAQWQPWKQNPILQLERRDEYLALVLERVRDQGALTASDLPAVPGPKRKPGDWYKSIPRCALEYHFGQGQLAVSNRLPNFQRVYDLPERLIPERHFARRPEREEADRDLLRLAAGSFGLGTLQDLADYYRMSPRDAAPRIDELVEMGDLYPIEVEGWERPAFLAKGARIPREIPGASLLSPFDPVVWFRPRAERLFNFEYRIEIYVPESKRRWGYYVLPFRVGDTIVARVDLKADRGESRLLVRHAYLEEGADPGKTLTLLAAELAGLADWLGLAEVAVTPHNDFSKRLQGLL